MMAVRAPLGFSPSTKPLISAFSPFSEHPDSPRPRSAMTSNQPMSATEKNTSSSDSHLRAPPANYITSPQDPIAPSPVASDVTNFEDVDEEVAEDATEEDTATEASLRSDAIHRAALISPSREGPPNIATPLRVDTGLLLEQQLRARPDEEGEPQSVIHIPAGFGQFPIDPASSTKPSEPSRASDEKALETALAQQKEVERARAGSTDSQASDSTVTNSVVSEARPATKTHELPMPPTPLQTSLPPLPLHDWSRTPRAQTRQDLSSLSRPGSSLASIQEGDDTDHPSTDETGEDSQLGQHFLRDAEAEINALRNALSECWTLCNTLASLSHIHRERIFNFSGRGDMQEQAWKSCWKLCQNLYNTRDDNTPQAFSHNSSRPTLDLCRDFCQALFEVRVRDNETADSVLRVSFELNNHLFNTHDRSLPEAFRERTLDFYITLCHRLMKQKSTMADETDSLLRACWSLAEMLFSLRQNRREGKKVDEELLGSAIQACWELCDLFREGWTQIRPERGTPRPSQTTFTQAFNQAKRSGFAPLDEDGNPRPLLPETPTTIFEDTITTISPDEAPIPNILVLGAEEASRVSTSSASSTPAPTAGQPQRHISPNPPTRHPHSAQPTTSATTNNPRWSSNSSVLSVPASAASEGVPGPVSATTVSTIRTPSEDPTLVLLKTLFVKAALATGHGYTRNSPDPNLNSLPNFVNSLPDDAFGHQVWQVALLENYRKAVMNDSGFRNLGVAGTLGERARVNAVDVARAVRGMTSCVYGFGWLRDLYRYVFGFYVEEALKGNENRVGRRSTRPQAGAAAKGVIAAVMGSVAASGVASATTPGGGGTVGGGGGASAGGVTTNKSGHTKNNTSAGSSISTTSSKGSGNGHGHGRRTASQ